MFCSNTTPTSSTRNITLFLSMFIVLVFLFQSSLQAPVMSEVPASDESFDEYNHNYDNSEDNYNEHSDDSSEDPSNYDENFDDPKPDSYPSYEGNYEDTSYDVTNYNDVSNYDDDSNYNDVSNYTDETNYDNYDDYGDGYDDYQYEVYYCDGGNKVIEIEQLCDYVRDCKDGSDEYLETCKGHNVIVENESDFTRIYVESTTVATTTTRISDDAETTVEPEMRNSGGQDYDEDDGGDYYDDYGDYEVVCASDEFMCPSDRLCISIRYICDGFVDCTLGEDEEKCVTNRAAPKPDIYHTEEFLENFLGGRGDENEEESVSKLIVKEKPDYDLVEDEETVNEQLQSSLSFLREGHVAKIEPIVNPVAHQDMNTIITNTESKLVEKLSLLNDLLEKVEKKSNAPEAKKQRRGAKSKVKKDLGNLVKHVSELLTTDNKKKDRRRKNSSEKIELHLKISDETKRSRMNFKKDDLKMDLNVEFLI